MKIFKATKKRKRGQSSSRPSAASTLPPSEVVDFPSSPDASIPSVNTADFPEGIKELCACENPIVDICFVHGLTGDRERTWTAPGQKNSWPELLLPSRLRHARILTWGYDAYVVRKGIASSNRLIDHSTNLLNDLTADRASKNASSRTLIFVAHSLGGLVCKSTLMTSRSNPELHLRSVFENTKAVVFMGTPHTGSWIADWARVPAKGLGILKSTNKDLLSILQSSEQHLESIQVDFLSMLRDLSENCGRQIKVACFFEELGMPIVGKVVPKDSATFAGYNPMGIHANHRDMVRFATSDDNGFKRVVGELARWEAELETERRNKKTPADKSLLRSLVYPEMRYRRQEADESHPYTCRWIFTHNNFTTWMSRDRGLLWVKGKPGAGKSTLMAMIYRNFQESPVSEQALSLDFFFHGRGTSLQKIALGMFRSFLYQLYSQEYSVRDTIQRAFKEKEDFGEAGKDWEWQTTELQNLFSNTILQAARIRKITIFVDALDEAGSAANDLVNYFHELNDRLDDENSAVKICISCRHYPVTATIPGLEILVEKNNEGDIFTFVRAKLRAKSIASIELENEIIQRASGVFLWARLTVPLVIQYHLEGESPDYIRRCIQKVPSDLGEVYEHILKNVIEHRNQKRTLHLMQWICLAERPLSTTELRYAIASDNDYINPSRLYRKDSFDFIETDDRMEKLTTSLSGGLAEVIHHEDGATVQFIHQSVKDFLLSDGLIFLLSTAAVTPSGNPTYPGNLSTVEIVSLSQLRLCESCINYLRLAEVQLSYWTKGKALQDFPFTDYATKNLFQHAEKAENSVVSPKELLQWSESFQEILDKWVEIYNVIDNSADKCPKNRSTLLHVSCSSNLQRTVQLLLRRGMDIEAEDEVGNRALHYASRWGHKELTRLLLDTGAKIAAKNNTSQSPLLCAAGSGHEDIVKLLLKRGSPVNESSGEHGNALQETAKFGRAGIARFLLEAGADVNAQGGHHGNALAAAAAVRYGDGEAVVRRLLVAGADVNAQGGHHGNALAAAAAMRYGGGETVVRLLLEAGADVNAQGGQHGTALAAAAGAYGGSKAVVRLLLEAGADVNAQGGQYGNALAAAAAEYGAGEVVVRLLLEAGADVNAQGGPHGTALAAATAAARRWGSGEAVVRLLLEAGADVNAQGGHHGNALAAAAAAGRWGSGEAVVRLLLEAGADVNAQGGHHGNALAAAAAVGDGGGEAVVRLLLEAGADVNVQGGEHGNALAAAAAVEDGSGEAVVRLLLEAGADVNAQGGPHGTALAAARYGGDEAVVRLLLEAGADVNAQGGQHGTALAAAAEYWGGEAVVRLSLEAGADSTISL